MHEIEFRKGQAAMAYVYDPADQRTVPWHGLGKPLTGAATTSEILTAADLDWEVEKYPVFVEVPSTDPTSITGIETKSVEDAFAIVRSDDHKPLGVVGKWYAEFTNRQIAEFGQSIVDNYGATWDTAMSLRGGRIVAMSMKLDTMPLANIEDFLDLYLMLVSSHDGSKALSADVVGIRPVCMNTVRAAQAGARNSVKIRHLGTLEDRVEGARDALGMVTQWSVTYAETMERLADQKVDLGQVDAFLAEMFPANAKAKNAEVALARATSEREALRAHLLHTPTVKEDLRLTKYGLYQATTEFVEHVRGIRPDSRVPLAEQRVLATALGGPIAQMGEKALTLLTVGG